MIRWHLCGGTYRPLNAYAISTSTVDSFLANPVPPEQPEPRFNPGQPQSSGPTCCFQLTAGSDRLDAFLCQVRSRVNSNGDTVYDVVEPNGVSRTVVLWEGTKAEVILKGQVYEGEWVKDGDGDIRVDVNGGVFAFSPPK